MITFSKQFASIFFIGFIALAAAISLGGMAGNTFADNPYLMALRYLGAGFMACGMVLWIVARRTEAGRPGLNALLGMLVVGSLLALLLGQIFAPGLAYLAGPIGLGFALSALAVGVLSMIIAPAYPRPLTASWPEGGLAHPDPHIPAEELHRVEGHPVQPDDLTRIEGIGPKLEGILNQAGIDTYKELATLTPEALKDLVRSAHFTSPVDTTTWPRQAALAASGDWEALAALQAQLRRGREV